LRLLSTVGLRALIEAVVEDNLDPSRFGSTLESKIDALSDLFEPKTIDVLHAFRVMGNKAIHHRVGPEALDVHRALNVVEGMMEYFYGIPESVDSFRSLNDTRDED
jgi:hypothetical protein